MSQAVVFHIIVPCVALLYWRINGDRKERKLIKIVNGVRESWNMVMQTSNDAMQTSNDAMQTSNDAMQTSSDVMQTSSDVMQNLSGVAQNKNVAENERWKIKNWK